MRAVGRSQSSLRRALVSLGFMAGVLGCVLGARRALSRPRSVPTFTPSAVPGDPMLEVRARLQQFEQQRRRTTDFAHLPPANVTHGADPYALARMDAGHFVGVLRGASALVVLDADLREQSRISIPESVIALAATAPDECWVGGERSPWLLHYRLTKHGLERVDALRVPRILGIRALSPGPMGVLYALDVHDGQLLTLRPHAGHALQVRSRAVGHGPLSLARVGSTLIVDLLLDHTLLAFRLNPQGDIVEERARIVHDGPIWGFDVAQLPADELSLIATGVEDHPLDRSDGAFGYIDSFAFQYLLPKGGGARRLWQANVSDLGVVTPKAPILRVDGANAHAFIAGYGSDHAVELSFDTHGGVAPIAAEKSFVPGASAALALDAGRLGFADPLLDAWLVRPSSKAGSARVELRPVEAETTPRAPVNERLGEALFFTTLMSPANSSAGSHSRFTCETCHFEGYVDGRVHHTGRGDVRVSTKPLRGLFNNRPHFSRALDPDLATVSQHEFRVAGQGSGTDPWFSVHTTEVPWLETLGVTEAELGPEALRRALMAFLMRFSHTTNPAVSGRQGFNATEQSGAALFRDQCARCHAARIESDVPESALPFDAWEQAIFSKEGPIVWASADYQKTGVTPYVHELGARVPSLRRLSLKWPHFTNGSADTVRDVLTAARFDRTRFFHAQAPSDPKLCALSAPEVRDLAAFLDLL